MRFKNLRNLYCRSLSPLPDLSTMIEVPPNTILAMNLKISCELTVYKKMFWNNKQVRGSVWKMTRWPLTLPQPVNNCLNYCSRCPFCDVMTHLLYQFQSTAKPSTPDSTWNLHLVSASEQCPNLILQTHLQSMWRTA